MRELNQRDRNARPHVRPNFLSALLNQPYDGIADATEFPWAKISHLTCDKAGMRSEEFTRTRIAGESQGAALKIGRVQTNGAGVAIRLAGDLAGYPVASAGFRENDGGAQFGSRKVGKGEPNYDDLPGCKCAHAASSSGRFQSSAKAISLSSASSLTEGASSRIVTSARRGEVTRTGSISR